MDNPRAEPATSRQPATGRDQELWEPTIHDVLLAQRRIAPHLTPTPLLKPAALARALGCEAYVKCENLQPVGAFKVRGGVNLVAALVEQGGPGPAGLATASTNVNRPASM
jgi:threonine dehydratase